MFATQFTDTFIDGTIFPPIQHETEDAARRYAVEFTSRRQGEMQIRGVEVGELLDTYAEGRPIVEGR